jgi:ubiquitin-protein ligase
VTSTARQDRLRIEHQQMLALRAASAILDFRTQEEPPELYRLTIRGRGLHRETSSGVVSPIGLHEIDIRLPLGFPSEAPDVRWLTPLFHPNISFGGFVRLGDIGVTWHESMSLEMLCERLWDVARLAFVNPQQVVSAAAQRWLTDQREISLPIDPRPLRDRQVHWNSNIIRYRRRDNGRIEFPTETRIDATEIFYIGDDVPATAAADRDVATDSRIAGATNEILFIGDENSAESQTHSVGEPWREDRPRGENR